MKRKFLLLVGFIIALVVLLSILESVAVKKLNSYLNDLSPKLDIKISDIDLKILLGQYWFENIVVNLRDQSIPLLQIDRVIISVSWKELLQGKVLADVRIQSPRVSYQKQMPQIVKEIRKELMKSEEVPKKLVPFEIQRFEIQDGVIDLDSAFDSKQRLVIKDLNFEVRDLVLSKDVGTSPFSLSALILSSGELSIHGLLKRERPSPSWSLDLVLKSLDLTKLNVLLREKVPITFTKGRLDLFGEVKSEHEHAMGYLKTFFRDLDVIKETEKFNGPRHVLLEVISALGNLILRSPKGESVATKIPFEYTPGNLKVDTGKALEKVIEHGLKSRLSPGIEDQYEL